VPGIVGHFVVHLVKQRFQRLYGASSDEEVIFAMDETFGLSPGLCAEPFDEVQTERLGVRSDDGVVVVIVKRGCESADSVARHGGRNGFAGHGDVAEYGIGVWKL